MSAPMVQPPVRVSHLLATSFFGGPEKQLLEHARRLERSGFTLRILSFVEGGKVNELVERARETGLAAKELPARHPFHPGAVGDLRRELREERTTLLCVHGYRANVIGRLAAWREKIPVVAISRGWTGENSRIRLYETLDRWFLRYADHIVAVSGGQKDKIVRLGIPAEKVTVIHNAVALSAPPPAAPGLRRLYRLPDDAPLVVAAGRLSPEKNFAALVAAAPAILAAVPETRFLVFGEGALRDDLHRAVEAAGLAGRFFFPGFRPDVAACLGEADVFALTSFTEGLPNVVLEACAAGTAVVATAVGGVPEIITDGVSGYLIAPEETDRLADRVIRLLRDPELRRRIGSEGRSQVLERFDFASQTVKYQELYSSISGVRA